MVREARLPRRRERAAADERRRGDRVVRRTERALGRSATRRRASPATLWIRVTSIASARVSGGRIEGSRRASIVLPTPGGPDSSRLWPPAAAIVERADRRRVAADVREVGDDAGRGGSRRLGATAGGRPRAGRRPPRPARPRRRRPTRRRARPRAARSRGTTSPRRPARSVPSATASTPRSGRSSPPSDSSPKTAKRSSASAGTWPLAASTAAAIARSKPGPALRSDAGARLTVTRRAGNSKPEFRTAARTRSRASRTAAVAEPDDREARQPGPQVDLDGDAAGVDARSMAKVVTRASTPATLGRVMSRRTGATVPNLPRLSVGFARPGAAALRGRFEGDVRPGRDRADRARSLRRIVTNSVSAVTPRRLAWPTCPATPDSFSAAPARTSPSPTCSVSATSSSRATTARAGARSTSSSTTPRRSSSSRSRRAARRRRAEVRGRRCTSASGRKCGGWPPPTWPRSTGARARSSCASTRSASSIDPHGRLVRLDHLEAAF